MGSIAQIKLTTLSGSIYRTADPAVGVNTTFDPERFLQGGIARYVDRSGGVPLGYRSITFSLRPPTKDSRVYKLSVRLASPVLETVDPATGIFGPKLAYTLTSIAEHLIPERATSAERSAHMNIFRSMYFGTINASDDVPTDSTGSPVMLGATNLEDVY